MKNKLALKTTLLVSIFALLLVTALFVVSGIPTGNTIDFILDVPSNRIQSGNQFEAVFRIATQDLEAFNLAGFQAEIQFDSELYEITEVEDLSGDTTIAQFTTNNNAVKYICVNDFTTETEGYKTFGDIFSVTLTAKKDITDVSKTIATNDFELLLGDYNSKKITDYTVTVNYLTPEVVVTGDLNKNGTVATEDAIYLLYNTVYGDAKYPLNQDCDFDNNGKLNSDDAIYLLYHVVFGADKYPLN